MPAPIPGRCLCGAVDMEITPPTELCSHCHCESCRRAHAAPLVTWTEPEAHVSFEEHVSWLEVGDGLPRHRGKSGERVD